MITKLKKLIAKPAHKLRLCGLTIMCALASIPIPATSATFTVSPVRIYMTPQDRAVAITITNEGDDMLVMQADIFEWKQKENGVDDLTLTEDLFLSPPILQVPGKSRQVVRLARVNRTPLAQELTYRIIVREIPEATAPNKDLRLQIALAFSMPIFITPPRAKSALDCNTVRVVADKVTALCENMGTAHAHPTTFELSNAAGEIIASSKTGGYMLPGIKRAFGLEANADAKKDGKLNSAAGAKGKLVVTLADTTLRSFDVVINPNL
jgi:fimbrial chaperone protein